MATHLTQFGFKQDALKVERACSVKGYACITLKTDAELRVDIYCTPRGQALVLSVAGKHYRITKTGLVEVP